MGDGAECVKVAVRCRPLSKKELGNDECSIVVLKENTSKEGSGMVVITDPEGKEKPGEYAFDIVFGTGTEQPTVFEAVGQPAIESTLNGYNGTIFAYGQTGSGKSWCMMGAAGDDKGIIPRVNDKLFDTINQEIESQTTRKFLVQCSFFEIYNEIIFDLLNPVQDRTKLGAGLQVKEHPVLGVYVKDLQEIVVSDSKKLEDLMNSGTKNRAVSCTMMNATSSRSHSVFTINVHQKDEEDKSKNVFAKLNLVDLAGSERQKGTGATGQTLKEGANINKSLSALGNVINALVATANGKKGVFVPYRNSKLTRVLQESLGGNSLCTMLATLSPAACNFEETVSTLRYANRAKDIKVSATKNEEASQISRLNAEIAELKKKLAAGGPASTGNSLLAEEERQDMKAKFQQQLTEMEAMVNGTWEEKERLSKDHETQLQKALSIQKRQARQMQEEYQKRLRLLEEQQDVELSLRGLLDTLQSLPGESRTGLRSGNLPRQWLKMNGSLVEIADALKQQRTVALLFRGAFGEDLRLWVDGEEANDPAMACAGARRALTVIETFRRESKKLSALEVEGRNKARKFMEAVAAARNEWMESGAAAVSAEISEESDNEGMPSLHSQMLKGIGHILQLIDKQSAARAESFFQLASLDMRSLAGLVLKGVSDNPADANDLMVIRSVREGGDDDLTNIPPTPTSPSKAAPSVEKPLHMWTAQDTGDGVEDTEKVLSEVVQLSTLASKKHPADLLLRPPPKFVHDVAILVRDTTGFPQCVPDEWPEGRDDKITLLQNLSDAVATANGIPGLEFDPGDVLKGKGVPRTLKLFQLLALAGAKAKAGHPPEPNGSKQISHEKKKGNELLSAGDVPPFLDAMVRIIQTAKKRHEKLKAPAEDMQKISAKPELENRYKALQERLEDEQQVKKRQEERLAALQKELEAMKAATIQRKADLAESQTAANNVDRKKAELRNQVEILRAEVLNKATEIADNPSVAEARTELETISENVKITNATKIALANEVKRLTQLRMVAEVQKEALENDLSRLRSHMGDELANTVDPAQLEEIIMLQAEKQKLDVHVAALEEKQRICAEQDDETRQRESGSLEEQLLAVSRNDDVQTQLQVVTEERDALRDGMDQLWQEKTRCNEQLEDVSNGYLNLSDRLVEKCEEARELEEKLQQYDNLLSMLQENFEKSQRSVAGSSASDCPASPSGGDGLDVTQLPATKKNKKASPTVDTWIPQVAEEPLPSHASITSERSSDSSHYTDDDFEDEEGEDEDDENEDDEDDDEDD